MDTDAHGFFEVKKTRLSAMQLWLDKVSGREQNRSHEAARYPSEDRRADVVRGCGSGGGSLRSGSYPVSDVDEIACARQMES
jgi:hypothetical protein